MKTPVAFFCVLLVLGRVVADPYGIAIQQAKRASDQNAAEQQQLQNQEGTAGAARGVAGQNPAKTDPVLAATLQNITNLQADFAALNNSTAALPDPSQKIALMNDLSAAAQSTKASPDSIKVLAKDLLTALAGNKKMPAPQKKLAREIHAVFNSSHLTPDQEKMIFDDVQKTLQAAGVSLDSAVDVVTDLKKVSSETK